MAAGAMSRDWRLDWAFPALGRLPTTLPWRLVHWLGRDAPAVRRATELFLQQRFSQVFLGATGEQHRQWARAHLDMLATEMLDAAALHRLGEPGGPSITLQGWGHVQTLQQRGQGFILVLNHYDRLLTAVIALGRRGVALNILTMPVVDNPGLGEAQRAFLVRKIAATTRITGGQWRTSSEPLRPVHEGLRKGQGWVILADAWSPDFARMRDHAFLGGYLRLPTGIERLAESTGAALLHACTRSLAPDRLEVAVEALSGSPQAAIDAVIQRLDRDVRERPWAWWHWGLWDQMWRPAAQEGESNV
ncbi:hypothetical protein HF896_03815 [Alicycliphilus denitrificans]|uniref:Lipid A biosynthesis acyltransferase n=3 Tax=Alicycliphilus denitrificans TaxID=179636 RepID=F4G5F2_ALIDK|nr:hypothetical protein [Alicycliphilus denitrificans]ADU98436.1 hypothetical protein Alide_0668 [Alicycliphilus denitrificans BC]AEB83044.1 hypothetical protein Alide2_0628 [Alicycliphilus denitrificans K601]QKD42785.1 hypothetical protein HF896_03815 [Alicycliphilus denitrificans]